MGRFEDRSDSDGDGYGNQFIVIEAPDGYVTNATDCDDRNNARYDLDGDNPN